jgi:hypothetical protein
VSWGTGVTAGSFSPKKAPELPRAPFAVYSDGRLLLNFPYFGVGTAAGRVTEFAGALQDAGIVLPVTYLGHSVTLPASDWMPHADSLTTAMNRVLAK